jgi:uncharacterized membrane protein YphA (DoxX/SURF4 family)
MSRSAAIFLVLLRLSIGWHFLFEGVQKVRSHYIGETVTNRPFTAASYFRDAPGPAGTAWRWAVGDPTEQALARLTPLPPRKGAEPALDLPFLRMPPGLKDDWRALARRYVAHYGIDAGRIDVDDEGSGKVGDPLLAKHGNEVVRWLEWQPDPILDSVRARFGRLDKVDLDLLNERERAAYSAYVDNTTEQRRSFPGGEVTVRMTMAERVAELRRKAAELEELSGKRNWLFGKEVEKASLASLRAEVARLREGMLDDLARTHTAAYLRSLNNLVAEPVADAVSRLAREQSFPEAEPFDRDFSVLMAVKAASVKVEPINPRLIREQLILLADEADLKKKRTVELRAGIDALPDVGPLPPAGPPPLVWWVDFLTRWGLMVVGGCILIGLFTRTACWLAALFLLTTYLAMPAFPWSPTLGPSEGQYLFVNKNAVEMFALCALGCLRTGRWFGADGLLYGLWGLMFGSEPEADKES